MKNNIKLKIIFFAYHSTTVLKEYWQHLKDMASCSWVTTHPDVYNEIKNMGENNIYFENIYGIRSKEQKINVFLNNYDWVVYKIIKKIWIKLFALYRRIFNKNTLPKKLQQIIQEINADILITNTTLPLLKYVAERPRAMTVQVFHGVAYKKYYTLPQNLKYDFLLLPSEHHKNKISQRHVVDNPRKLAVVGWPRTDNLIHKKISIGERETFIRKLGLNTGFKNVLYAPTWDAFAKCGIFPKSFGFYLDVFEKFCKGVKKLNLNLIIKLHHASIKNVENQRLHQIAQKYNAHFAYKKSTGYLSSSIEDFLKITDILISDISGVITDFMVLNRPIIFIEPDNEEFKWEDSDLGEDFRPGIIANSVEELLNGIKRSLHSSVEYETQRKEVLRKIFYRVDGQASKRGADAILNYYNNEFLKQKIGG